jgi:hypothetical protein
MKLPIRFGVTYNKIGTIIITTKIIIAAITPIRTTSVATGNILDSYFGHRLF